MYIHSLYLRRIPFPIPFLCQVLILLLFRRRKLLVFLVKLFVELSNSVLPPCISLVLNLPSQPMLLLMIPHLATGPLTTPSGHRLLLLEALTLYVIPLGQCLA